MLNFKKPISTEGHEQDSTPDQQDPNVDVPDPAVKKKPRSEKQREASRRNGSRGHGPHDTTRTRYNAVKTGLTAEGLTKWDNSQEYEQIINALMLTYPSSNPLSVFYVRKLALYILRSDRVARQEAETLTVLSSASAASSEPIAGFPAPFIDPLIMKEYAGPILDRLQRYDSQIMNNLVRCRRELDRIKQEEEDSVGNDSDQ